MDTSAVNVNVTVDDFDSVVSYPDQSVWQTPDPSSSTFTADGSPWWMGTYHKTDVVDASFSFNFTGPAIYIYGHSGPQYGSYEVELDSASSTLSAYAASNGSTPHLLYGASNLTYDVHSIVLRNLGPKDGDGSGASAFLFDYLQTTIQLAPADARVSNTTIQEDDSTLTYSGTWGSNKSGNFSGGGSTYTQGDEASVSLSFHGSAIYVFGDKKNDHGLYSVVLDNATAEIYNGVSGCGGAFGMTCEQQQPTLKYLASNLDQGLHELKITNIAGVNQSYFDLDSIVISVPSTYAPRNLSGSSSSDGTSTSPTSSSSSSSSPSSSESAASSASSNSAMSLLVASNPLLFLVLGGLWFVRRCTR